MSDRVDATQVSPRPVAAVYARQSKDYPLSLDHQHRDLVQCAEDDGFLVPNGPEFRFGDNDVTGVTKNRHDLGRMERLVQDSQHRFSRIYIKDRSRFARFTDLRQQLGYEFNFADQGAEIVFTDEDPINWADPSGASSGEQVLGVIKTMNTSRERHQIIERVRMGKRDAIKDGSFPGTRPMYGAVRWLQDKQTGEWLEEYLSNRGGRRPGTLIRLRWDAEKVGVVKRIFAMAAEGCSQRNIALTLTEEGIPSPSGARKWHPEIVGRILRHRVYVGDLHWGIGSSDLVPELASTVKLRSRTPMILPDAVEDPPIPESLWQDVQEKLDGVGAEWSRRLATSQEYLLGGLLVCSDCGVGIHGKSGNRRPDGSKRRYYHHPVARGPKRNSDVERVVDSTACPHRGRYIPADAIEGLVELTSRSLLRNPAIVDLVNQAIEDRIAQGESSRNGERIQSLEESLFKLNAEIERAARWASEATDPDVASVHANIVAAKTAERKRMARTLDELRSETDVLLAARKGMEGVSPPWLQTEWERLSDPERKQSIAGLIHHIEVDLDDSALLVVCRTKPQ